jgi:ribosome-associated translation inhibitor RaiA
METLITFSLGAVTVLIILGLVAVSKLIKQVKELKSHCQSLETWVERNDEMVNRRIDGEINRVNKMDTDLYSFIDSRLDKLENKLSK